MLTGMMMLPRRRRLAEHVLPRIVRRSAGALMVLVITACALFAISVAVDAGSARGASISATQSIPESPVQKPPLVSNGSQTGSAVDGHCVSTCIEPRDSHVSGIALLLVLLGGARPAAWGVLPSRRSSDLSPPDLRSTEMLPPKPDLTTLSVCIR